MMHNTFEPIDYGTHLLTSPFARAIYATSSTSVVIDSWNDVYTTQPNAAEIGIYVDGVYQESVRPTANGAARHTVTLPAGEKTVEIVTNGFRAPADNSVVSTIGSGIWLRGIVFNSSAIAVQPTKRRGLVIVADSIANGSGLVSAVQQAYPRLMQAQRLFPITIVGRGGMALYDVTDRLSLEYLFRPIKLAREVLAHNPLNVLYTAGFNDDFKSVWSPASNVAAYIAAGCRFVQSMYDADPSVAVVTMPILFATSTGPNYAAFRDAAASFGYQPVPMSSWFTYAVPAPTLVAGDLSDGIHPNAGGHAKMAAALLPLFLENGMPPGFVFNTSVVNAGAVPQASRRASLNGPAYTYRASPNTSTQLVANPTLPSLTPNRVRQFIEISVNGAPWVWAHSGGNNDTLDLNVLPADIPNSTAVRFRRRGGNGDIIHTMTINYS